jgi:septum formation protein
VTGRGELSWGDRFLGLAGRRLILASASPRRAALLADLGVTFTIRPVDVPETPQPGESPAEAVRRLAGAKALSAIRDDEGPALVLGADTLVVLGREALGKPRHADHARDMLRRLSGRTHEVLTGIAIVRTPDRAVFSGVARTRVRFRDLSDEEIGWLVDSGEAEDKAGAYGIQGLASMAVESIEGDYFNVVGLPLGRLREVIRKAVRS